MLLIYSHYVRVNLLSPTSFIHTYRGMENTTDAVSFTTQDFEHMRYKSLKYCDLQHMIY